MWVFPQFKNRCYHSVWRFLNTEKSPSPEKKDPESPPITDSKQPPLPPSNGKAIDHGQKSKKFDTTSQAIPPPDLGENAQRQTTPNSYRCHINNMTVSFTDFSMEFNITWFPV